MKYRIIIAFTLLVHAGYAQHVVLNDSIAPRKTTSPWQRAIVAPVILITAGLATTVDNKVFDKWEVQEARTKMMPNFKTNVDDYMIFAPIAGVYALNAMGIKGEHNLANQTALLLKSEILMNALVFSMKKITAVARPTGELTSFPSGHTAQAFLAATFIHKEYGRDRPLVSLLAYSTATGVGMLRMMNNRHWVSDVLAGAGIGILSTNIVYLTHQNKWGRKHKKLQGAVVTPTFAQRSFGMYVALPIP